METWCRLGVAHQAEQQLAKLTPHFNDFDSRRASLWLGELHGSIATARHDWHDT